LLIDLLIGPVRWIEGAGMKYSAVGSTRGTIHYYSVGDLNFQIPSYGTYKKLHDADPAVGFYLPRSKTLVDLEWNTAAYGTSDGVPREIAGDPELAELYRLERAEQQKKG
jgi:hypothetical protein